MKRLTLVRSLEKKSRILAESNLVRNVKILVREIRILRKEMRDVKETLRKKK